MKKEFSKALQIVTNKIKKDFELKESYKANIAMAFKDEYARRKLEKKYLNSKDIHEIANKAATNFLQLWLD